jgi:hypothetical protein
MKNIIPKIIANIAIILINLRISCFIYVGGLLIVRVDLAIVPKKVPSPVAKTTQVALPEVKLQPILATFLASYRVSALALGPNLISTFSPVKEALLTFKSEASRTLTSAGTFSPVTTYTISPGTSNLASTFTSFPSLITLTSVGASFFKAAITYPDLPS